MEELDGGIGVAGVSNQYINPSITIPLPPPNPSIHRYHHCHRRRPRCTHPPTQSITITTHTGRSSPCPAKSIHPSLPPSTQAPPHPPTHPPLINSSIYYYHHQLSQAAASPLAGAALWVLSPPCQPYTRNNKTVRCARCEIR